jgi:hypothetical protein
MSEQIDHNSSVGAENGGMTPEKPVDNVDLAATQAQLRALLAGATPGPWWANHEDWSVRYSAYGDVATNVYERADRELIVAAVNALPALLDALDAGERRVAELEAEIRALNQFYAEECCEDWEVVKARMDAKFGEEGG